MSIYLEPSPNPQCRLWGGDRAFAYTHANDEVA
jgi:hypothetical protein